ncbi:MAG: hypothetical protein ACI8TP_001382 [Acidimicrobiales bacterium]|jgi:hypothetical protein
MSVVVTASPGAKVVYLIRRKSTTSREELVAHWFANHMPLVIARQKAQADLGKPHAHRYIATLFDPGSDGDHAWDGMAQLWWDRALPRPAVPLGTAPTDSFQEKAETYMPWPTTEYVVMDGSEHLDVEPLTLNPPFPCTRSGFVKMTFLVRSKPGIDHRELFAHWLDVHVPNVAGAMEQVGGFRYVVSHSHEPDVDPYAGMAEMYFHDAEGWPNYRRAIQDDGMGRWLDSAATVVMTGHTEMIGIQ